jgi:hypothetical protein
MADQPRKLPPRSRPASQKPLSQKSLPPTRPAQLAPPIKVNVLVAGDRPVPRRGVKSLLLTLLLLVGMGAAVIEGTWLAVQFMINPGSVPWLSWLLPEGHRAPLSRYQTLAEIQAEASEMGLVAGTGLPLTPRAEGELLIPILATHPQCHNASGCEHIVELRVYRPVLPYAGTHREEMELVDRLGVTGPKESFVVAPLATNTATSPGTTRPLPLTAVSIMPGAPAPEVWLNVSGEWSRGSDRATYGQLIHYVPKQHRLYPLIPWTSPAREAPVWQQITGSEAVELVVNETVGLEPDFRIYQPKPTTSATAPVQLIEISLAKSVLENRTYENGRTLAQHGLWSPALRLMQTAKQQDDRWSTATQAQLDLIALHAKVTQAQAERQWANPSQELLANLIDGRWTKALELLQAALADGYELDDLLTANGDRLWERVGVSLGVNANQPDVQAWGTLVLFGRQGRTAAIAWLQQRNSTIASLVARRPGDRPIALDNRLQQVLNLLNNTLLVADYPSRLIGTVDPIANPNIADWLRPQADTTLTLGEQQSWYRIQVDNFYDGTQWRRSPFADLNISAIGTAQQLWSLLGLTNDAQIQLIVWTADSQPQTIEATIKAVRLQNGALQLLASGDAPAGVSFAASDDRPRPLAMTTNTVHWVEPQRSLTLTELNQEQPVWASMLMPTLQQTLHPTSLVSTDTAASDEDVLQEMGNWTIQLLDLTGNDQPEAILSTPGTTSDRPQTLILSDQGTLIYSELGQDAGQSMTAIADAGDGKPALLVETAQSYQLRQWSLETQRFE